MTKSKKTSKTRQKWLRIGTKNNNTAFRSLLCIRFVAVAFQSEFVLPWIRPLADRAENNNACAGP